MSTGHEGATVLAMNVWDAATNQMYHSSSRVPADCEFSIDLVALDANDSEWKSGTFQIQVQIDANLSEPRCIGPKPSACCGMHSLEAVIKWTRFVHLIP